MRVEKVHNVEYSVVVWNWAELDVGFQMEKMGKI